MITRSQEMGFYKAVLRLCGRVGLYPLADRLLRKRVMTLAQHRVLSIGNFEISVDVRDYTGRRIWAGSFENKEIFFIQRVLPRDGCAVDVGANIGFISLVLASAVGEGGACAKHRAHPLNLSAPAGHTRSQQPGMGSCG